MADNTKQPSVAVEKELGHQLAAEGDAVVTDNVGTESDKHDMYRMGKVQQMQVSKRHQSSRMYVNDEQCIAYLPLLSDGEFLYGAHGVLGDRIGCFDNLAVQWRTGWHHLHEHRLLDRLSGRVQFHGRTGEHGSNKRRPVSLGQSILSLMPMLD